MLLYVIIIIMNNDNDYSNDNIVVQFSVYWVSKTIIIIFYSNAKHFEISAWTKYKQSERNNLEIFLLKYNAPSVSMNEHKTYFTHYACMIIICTFCSCITCITPIYLLLPYVHFKLQAFQNTKYSGKQGPVIKAV